MPTLNANGTDLYYEVDGVGPPLVLVHGNWSDHTSWGLLSPRLARNFRVLSYDRRGHGRSERRPGPTPRRENERDLIALIEEVHGEPAHVVGNSYGGLVSLSVTANRPDLVRSLSVHEPPALSLPATYEEGREIERLMATLRTVVEEIERGEVEQGARRFMEEAALGKGAWALIPNELRALFFDTAGAFAAEASAPNWTEVDLAGMRRFQRPILLTKGEFSPPWLPAIVERLSKALPAATTATVADAGHAPHGVNPAGYARQLTDFAERADAPDSSKQEQAILMG